MHEEPLRLIPPEWRDKAIARARASATTSHRVQDRGRPRPGVPLHLPAADGEVRRRLGQGGAQPRPRAAPGAVARRTASASARSSRRTRRTRTRPSSPATSTTARSPSTARTRDPRAFNFDGEFNIANRGIVEFVEVLKLDVAFLYDLLGATQEHKIKPKKFAQTDIDEVIIGHTNEAEYKKLAQQRVHGGAARPHDQDRHPVHHQGAARRSRSTRRTSRRSACAASTSRRTRSRSRRCGRC